VSASRFLVVAQPNGAEPARERPRGVIAEPAGTLLAHVAGRPDDLPRVAAATWALHDTGAFEQLVLDAEGSAAEELAALDARAAVRRLDGERLAALHGALAGCAPAAVVLHGDGDAALDAAIAAARLGIAIVRVGGAAPADPAARVAARLADLHLVFGHDDADALSARVGRERIHVVGNPLVDAVRRFSRAALGRAAWRGLRVAPGRYLLVVLGDDAPSVEVAEALAARAAREPVVVAASPAWRESGALDEAAAAGARIAGRIGFVQRLSLERGAAAIVSDGARACEEAAAIGVPAHPLAALAAPDEASAPAQPAPAAIPLWDGRAGARLARVLVANFARVRLG
jgi:UDP-N-acetylglucosamine 2-epimerase (non-hydrolysing)